MATTLKQTPAQNNAQDFLQIQDLLYLCLAKWKWFVLSLAVCLGAATIYLLKTPPVYKRTASILIKNDSKGGSSSGMEEFADFGMFSSNSNINNEMGILQSPELMCEVVSRLQLVMNYQVDGRFHRATVYGTQLPVTVELLDVLDGESASLTVELLGNGRIRLSQMARGGEEYPQVLTANIGHTIKSPLGRIAVREGKAYQADQALKLFVSHGTLRGSAAGYSAALTVAQNDEKSSIIDLSILDVSTQRAEDVLNTLIAVYNENWVKDKNQMAVSTSMFISDRLGVIEGELGNVDNDISSYKSANMLPDVNAAASMYMSQANQAQTSIMELNNQVYMARYVRNYLTGEGNRFQLLPTNSGLASDGLNNQISEYNAQLLERNSLVAQSSDRNPLVQEMDKTLTALRATLVRSIDNQLVALQAQIKSQQSYGGQATSRIASNPNQAKYLLSVERQQKVKESLYLYLLQKREENELSQAFTAYNTRVITMPSGSMIPTAPVRNNILLIAFAMGLLIPVAIIFIKENTNTVVRGRKDLDALTLPLVGEIPYHQVEAKGLFKKKKRDVRHVVVEEGSRDIVNEAFRVLRTNLEFMAGKEAGGNVILMTSFNPGSGKSFLSVNIALSLAIKHKRVLVIDGDLRHGSTSAYIGSPKQGLSDYLNGRVARVEDVLVTYPGHDTLQVLPVGTIPPNPTELLYEPRLKQAIDTLKTQYDYVLIDCPPVEMLADTQIIEQYADRTVFIVRAGLLDRSMLPELERLYQEKKYKNMSVILNGTEGTTGRYGRRYGYKYGYKYGYRYGYGKNAYGNYYGSDTKKKK